jgi:hypothetical protein
VSIKDIKTPGIPESNAYRFFIGLIDNLVAQEPGGRMLTQVKYPGNS